MFLLDAVRRYAVRADAVSFGRDKIIRENVFRIVDQCQFASFIRRGYSGYPASYHLPDGKKRVFKIRPVSVIPWEHGGRQLEAVAVLPGKCPGYRGAVHLPDVNYPGGIGRLDLLIRGNGQGVAVVCGDASGDVAHVFV